MKTKKDRIISKVLRPLYRWHRRIGMIAVLFVVVLSITGILLNHNAQLDLNKTKVTSSWLLALYGMDDQPMSEFGYPAETLTADRIILDIHTGRFFGKFGPLVMDLVAIALLFLSATGSYMWWKRSKKNRKKKPS